jgi:prepilin-type N-terminal cleavage/methylation domain-containing protein
MVHRAMYTTKKIAVRRDAFTLVEMLVVIAIILALAALAAAFAPRVNDNQKMTRAVDNLEQWLLTAKMRAKRDGLATGLRFVSAPGDAPGTYSQFQYIQQPEPLAGGYFNAAGPVGGFILSAGTGSPGGVGTVTFGNVDFSLGGLPPLDSFGRQQWLVQTGDYLEINGGGVYSIWGVVVPPPGLPASTIVLGGILTPTANPYFTNLWAPPTGMTVVNASGLTVFAPGGSTIPPGLFLWQSQYEQNLIVAATSQTNYRIIRQPRVLIGEEPLTLPDNYAVDTTLIPQTIIPGNGVAPNPSIFWSNVLPSMSGNLDILFSPTGAIVGSNASNGMVFISVYDRTLESPDVNSFISRVGIIGVQTRTGFIGAYGASAGAGSPGYNPFLLAQGARESGL